MNAMIANLHTHTPRCRHAVGSEEEYVQVALDAGYKVLGFSDHTPYFFPGDYYSHMRMYPDELEGYAATVRDLQKRYAGRIEIPLGLEVEYYPNLFPKLLPRLRDAGIEYMILGQHWNGDETDAEYNGYASDREAKLEQNCNQVIDAMHTGLFTYIAHPDIVNFIGSPKVYQKHVRRLCQAAKSCNIPLEINLLGIDEGRYYPNPLFWEVAAEEGNQVVIGMDAHTPEHVARTEAERTALAMVQALSLELIEMPELIRI